MIVSKCCDQDKIIAYSYDKKPKNTLIYLSKRKINDHDYLIHVTNIHGQGHDDCCG